MNKIDLFKKALKREWYTQGFAGVPVFLNLSAWSGLVMKKILGFGYTSFIHNYRKGYGEMDYLAADFAKIWKIVKNKLAANPNYLKNIEKQYHNIFKNHENLFAKIDNLNLNKISDRELLALFKKCCQAQTDSVGIAHIVDAMGIEIDKEFKKELTASSMDKKDFNKNFAVLTAPTKPSFIAKEESELIKIARIKGEKRKRKLQEHLKKYFWIQNSYAGPKKLNIESLEARLKSLKSGKKQKNNAENIFREKLKLARQLKLTRRAMRMMNIIDFATIFQDERKRNIIKTVGYLGRIIEEISRRINVPKEVLYYLGVTDASEVKTIQDLKKMKNKLAKRIKGVFFLMGNGQEFSVLGSEYGKLMKIRKELSHNSGRGNEELHGSVANAGTAIGRVSVCKDLASLKNVRAGDILVASMTRPEFMPALKKAAAIVTDEGGITCHAAIISRELGIPCVVGTKIATRILKNGTMVEVKANHGIIKILK